MALLWIDPNVLGQRKRKKMLAILAVGMLISGLQFGSVLHLWRFQNVIFPVSPNSDTMLYTGSIVTSPPQPSESPRPIANNANDLNGSFLVSQPHNATNVVPNGTSLCEECWKIVQKAPRVNLSFAPIPTDSHPYMGARDARGQWGYVHNVYNLQQNPPNPQGWSFTKILENRRYCDVRDDHWTALQRIQLPKLPGTVSELTPASATKILCAVYSSEPFHHKLHAIRETWAPKCDGFFVASNLTDASLDAVDIPHEGIESYRNMWQKVRSLLSYAYANYYNEFDWFHIGGDDLWVIVDNLREYLHSDEIRIAANGGIEFGSHSAFLDNETQVPLLLGCHFAQGGKLSQLYITGGPGYTLNKAALKLLVTEGMDYFQHKITSTEDVLVSRIFHTLGVDPYPTLDPVGAERYHHFTPGQHFNATRRMYHWYHVWKRPFPKNPIGPNHSSTRSVAFHLVDSENMRRFHVLTEGLCNS